MPFQDTTAGREELELPSSSALLAPPTLLDDVMNIDTALCRLAGELQGPSLSDLRSERCPALSASVAGHNPGDILHAPNHDPGNGRRPRPSLADWGGNGLGEVLRQGRRLAPPSVAYESGVEVLPQPRVLLEPDLTAWGGSLSEVLCRRSARMPRRQESGLHARGHAHPMDGEGTLTGARAETVPGASIPGSGAGLRPRATIRDFGGSLAEVLRAVPPRPARRPLVAGAQHHDQPRDGSPSRMHVGVPAEIAPTTWPGWEGTLSTVLPPRSATRSEETAGLIGRATAATVQRAASVGANAGLGDGAEPLWRRARSVVVRQGDSESECPICLDFFELHKRLVELPCRHRFHAPCLREYFSVAVVPRCPCCRADCSHVIV